MTRFAGVIALLFIIPAANAHAAGVTLKFKGTIQAVVDAGDPDMPAINLPAIPVGSPFFGTVTYDTTSPRTDGGTGYSRYIGLNPSSGSLTVNGNTFTAAQPNQVGAIIVSQESGFGFSGASFVNQGLSLPDGWNVDISDIPYFTLQFRDVPTKARSLALPSLAEIPTDAMNLVFDFLQPATVDGQTYGGRVYITGQITSLTPPPRQVTIDVDPSSSANKINLNGNNPKPLKVAVFGNTNFNVRDVAPQSIRLGDPILTDPVIGTGETTLPTTVEYVDVNRDGRLDLLLSFSLIALEEAGAIDSSSTSLLFQAILNNQGVVFGSDAVSVSEPKGKGHK